MAKSTTFYAAHLNKTQNAIEVWTLIIRLRGGHIDHRASKPLNFQKLVSDSLWLISFSSMGQDSNPYPTVSELASHWGQRGQHDFDSCKEKFFFTMSF